MGDFNGDGLQDLAVLSGSGIGSVNIYLGNGDGTFQAAKNYPVATTASSSRILAMGDFNGDGFQDLVATNPGLNQVGVILGNGDGTFNAPSSYDVGPQPWNVVVGDINQDGFLDLAVASDGSGSASILQGNGDGTFQAYTTATVGSQQVGSVALGDFNGDGYPDLATTSNPDNSIYILLNLKTATPSFGAATAVNPGVNAGPYYLTVGDFNRDGKLDLISANDGNNSVGVLLGTGTGTFGAVSSYGVGGGDVFATAGDINGDDQVDLTAITGTGLAVLLSGQSESASLANITINGCGAQAVTATYNGDGNYAASTSASANFTPVIQATSLVLDALPPSGAIGTQVLLQAALSPHIYGTTNSDGEMVSFYDNGRLIGRAQLYLGMASLDYTLTRATYSFTAVYRGDCSFQGSTSNAVTGTPLRASTITWATPAPISYGTPLSATQLDAHDTLPGSYDYYPTAGTILPVGNNTLYVIFTPNDPSYGQEVTTVQLAVTEAQTVITWPTPTPIAYGTPLSGFQLDATASLGVKSVPLNNYYNVYGIYRPGAHYNTGGFDNDGYSYSTTTVGRTIVWNGMTFNIGPSNAKDAVANTTITLPTGNFTNLFMLGAMVNNVSAAQTFTVNYSDGSNTTVTINMSDWFNAKGWSGESVISCSEDRNYENGTAQPDSACVYGYQIPLDSSKTVKNVVLPATRDVVMLAMDLSTPPIPGTFVYTPPAGTIEPVGTNTLSVTFTPSSSDYTTATGTVQLVVGPAVTPIVTTTLSWPTPAPITYGTPLSATQLDAVAMAASRPTPVIPTTQLQVLATSNDGVQYNLAGFDNQGGTYSYNALNNGAVTYAGTTFTLGTSTVPNAITNGAVYTLPAPGNYSTVYLIGAATTTGQINEPFILTYADANGAVTQTLSMSSWNAPAGYTGESVVATTDHQNNKNGSQTSGTYDLYGYQIPADPTRTLVSITLPSTRTVVIMALGFGTNSQVVVPGTYAYNPAAGAIEPVGTDTLSVTFTPTDPAAYTSATDTTQLVVTKATPILTWATPAPVAVGTRLSNTQLDAAATTPQGAPLAGTYVYTPAAGTRMTPAGVYTLSVTFTPTDTADYTTATATVQLLVGNAGFTTISGAGAYPDCCFFNQPTPYTITVGGTNNRTPTGTVEVIFNNTVVGTGTLSTLTAPQRCRNAAGEQQRVLPRQQHGDAELPGRRSLQPGNDDGDDRAAQSVDHGRCCGGEADLSVDHPLSVCAGRHYQLHLQPARCAEHGIQRCGHGNLRVWRTGVRGLRLHFRGCLHAVGTGCPERRSAGQLCTYRIVGVRSDAVPVPVGHVRRGTDCVEQRHPVDIECLAQPTAKCGLQSV